MRKSSPNSCCYHPWELALQATAGASLPECPPVGRSRLRGKLLQGAVVFDQPTHLRAFANMRNQGAFSKSRQSFGTQDCCTTRNTRPGCGILMVTRPSGVVKPVAARGEPFGLAGYCSVGLPRPST